MANADAFMFEAVATADGNGIVGMHLEDWIGTFGNKVEFILVVHIDKNALTYNEFVFGAFAVCTNEAVVDLRLAMFGQSNDAA